MHLYFGTGLRFNSSSVSAIPLDPMSKLAYNKAREGGEFKSYNFNQENASNPLVGTFF
jgi:hypothetical protein